MTNTEQTPLELAAKLIREVDSSSECASEFACDIRTVAAALIAQAARIAELEQERDKERLTRISVKAQYNSLRGEFQEANVRIEELERQLAQRDKALARVRQIASVYRHGGSCKLIRRCGSCDCWKADILAALDQKEPGA